ncbi:MAG: hypothetical protein MJ104_00135 [Lachnospiraceae bacterium]|nr:hypothetical protein [Lachnospiraceae bacterium]
MLNQDKVILMTRMASYESGKGKDHLRIGRYFRSDFAALSIIKAIFSITISFIFGVAIYVYYHFEEYMADIYELDFLELGKQFGKYYLILLVIYVAISYIVCMAQYINARVNIGRYKSSLKKLRKINKAQKED